ncbi:MAG: head GIN domain-containing protein [Anaerolineae bacterium]
MRSIVILIVGGLLMTSLACSVSFPNIEFDGETIRGSGNMVEETREVSGFSSVTLAGFGNLYIEVGETESLRIEAEDNLIDRITAEVRDNVLEIGWERGFVPVPSESVNYYLTVERLDTVTLDGAGNIEAEGLMADAFEVVVNGAGNVEIGELDVESLRVEISGAGDIDVSGTTETQTVMLNAAGNYNAEDLECQEAMVEINGLGSATVRASDTLDATINGAGSINYYGDPTVRQSINGVGDINRVGE